ncbi:MAG TPA: ABC-2 family transporter protein [Chloroflexota bacterium]|nr:ABC-2 family transporter protein [Chloroflexota bacterium]
MTVTLVSFILVIRLHLRLWWQFLLSDAMHLLEYRVNFLLGLVRQGATLALSIFGQGLLFQYTDEIAGWSRLELLLLLGVFWVFDAVWDMLLDGLSQVTYDVRAGVMDFVLLRPVSAQFLLSFRRVELLKVVNITTGIALIAYAGRQLELVWNPWGMLLALLFCACGFLTIYALRFMLVTCVFWLTSVRTLYDLLGPVFQVGQYPVVFFSGWVRFFLSFVVPVAFATTFPAEALLGVADARLLPVGIALAMLSLYVSHRFWLVAVRRYASAEG